MFLLTIYKMSEKKLLLKIFESNKIHLTVSQKRFIEQSYEILSIFLPEIGHVISRRYEEIINSEKNRYIAGKKFFDYINELRYPVTTHKIIQLKNFLKQNKIRKNVNTLEFDELTLNISNQLLSRIRNILNIL